MRQQSHSMSQGWHGKAQSNSKCQGNGPRLGKWPAVFWKTKRTLIVRHQSNCLLLVPHLPRFLSGETEMLLFCPGQQEGNMYYLAALQGMEVLPLAALSSKLNCTILNSDASKCLEMPGSRHQAIRQKGAFF